MKEFIYRIEDNESDESEVFIGWIRKQGHELIRCMDCAWYDMAEPNNEDCPISYRCTRVNRLWREPDDFCKWAEREEE